MDSLNRVEINGVKLVYNEQGEGQPIVLVHGGLGDYRSWSRQVSERYRVISYSRRYHYPNSSSDGPIDYSYRRHVADLVALIRALGLASAHLVGDSYGAVVATLVAMEHPDMVNSLILCEPGFFTILSNSQDRVSLRLHRIALRVVQKLSENGEHELAVREYLKIVIGNDVFDQLALETQLVINQNAHILGPMLRTYFEPTDLDHVSARKITSPTLLITSEYTPGIYKAITRELNNRLPAAESILLPRSARDLHLEGPQEFGTTIVDFLSRNPVSEACPLSSKG